MRSVDEPTMTELDNSGNFLSIPASALPVPDLLDRVLTGDLGGFVVRQLLAASSIGAIVTGLVQDGECMLSTPCPYGRIYARCLVGVRDLECYFADAAVFREDCAQLFAPGPSFECLLVDALAQLSTDRSILSPLGPYGSHYAPATIRWMMPGTSIYPHCERIFSEGPEFVHLNQLAVSTSQLSFFMPLIVPEQGGELAVYELTWRDVRPDRLPMPGSHQYLTHIEDVLGRATVSNIPVHPGDLVVFDAGRRWHRVTTVVGTRPRITIGGFLSQARASRNLYYYS